MLHYSSRSNGRALLSSTRPRGVLDSAATTHILHSRTAIAARSYDWQQRRTSFKGMGERRLDRIHKARALGNLYTATNPLSAKLLATGMWGKQQAKSNGDTENKDKEADIKEVKVKKKRGRSKKDGVGSGKPAPGPRPDTGRVHITNEELVEDTLKYLAPTLERHRGCDLISIYPGSGAWTKALHGAVEPRSHLLLEPDEEFYRPFLKPLLSQDGVRIIPKHGVLWKDLNDVLTPEFLPHQVEWNPRNSKSAAEAGPPRNDTLLLSMNIAWFPAKTFQRFSSISRMVVYQILAAIRSSQLFYKYGQVRMLLWIPDGEKSPILPRSMLGRRRKAIEGELATEYIAEVCGTEPANPRPVAISTEDAADLSSHRTPERWTSMTLESVRQTYSRMKASGMQTPKGRESAHLRDLKTLNPKLLLKPFSIIDPPAAVAKLVETADKEVVDLMAKHAESPFPKGSREYKLAQFGKGLVWKRNNWMGVMRGLWAQYEAVLEAYADYQVRKRERRGTIKALELAKKLEAELDAQTAQLQDLHLQRWNNFRDSMHTLCKQPAHLGPVLMWDRRPYEPLPITGADFFPNVPLALLDIQAGNTHPLLRASGPGTDNTSEFLNSLLAAMMDAPTSSLAKTMAVLWPGADEGVVDACKQLNDIRLGGVPLRGTGAMANRAINREQTVAMLQAWMDWPFRPSYSELLGRLSPPDLDDEPLPELQALADA